MGKYIYIFYDEFHVYIYKFYDLLAEHSVPPPFYFLFIATEGSFINLLTLRWTLNPTVHEALY